MVIAMIAMRMVQMVVHQVIHMIPMGNGLMPTSGTVHMRLLVTAAGVLRSAASGIRRVDCQRVLLHGVAMGMVQVAIVQVIDVALVQNPLVAAVRAMLVRVLLVLGCHF
jgi:hypothetical protein